MGIQKYRFDKAGEQNPNGSIPLFTDWAGGPTLAGVKNCPIKGFPDVKPRTAYVTGEPCSYFSVPAAVRCRGKRVVGFLTHKNDPVYCPTSAVFLQNSPDSGYVFVPMKTEEHKLR